MILKKPFKVEVAYNKDSSEKEVAYNSLLEELNIGTTEEQDSRFVTVYCIDSIMPQTVTDNRCHLKTYSESFVTVKSYEEIEKELLNYL
jgi:hypothetical protein